VSLEPMLHNKRRHSSEKPMLAVNWSPCLPQLDKASAKLRGPSAAEHRPKKPKSESYNPKRKLLVIICKYILLAFSSILFFKKERE